MKSISKLNLKKSNLKYLSLRRRILNLSQKVGALHIGGSFSLVEIVDTIYNLLMKKNDKFILSKGHTAVLQYVILASKKL